MAEANIRITDKGPYIVTGGPRLTKRWQAETADGEPMEWDPVGAAGQDYPGEDRYTLCRCGHSANKPFCDGTHATTEAFDPTLTADRAPGESRRTAQEGGGLVLTDDGTLCADAGFCGTKLTNVWAMMEDPSDPEVRERLQRMVGHCPSGRLVLRKASGEALEPEFAPSIATVRNGPLWVRGGIPISAADGFAFEVRNRVTLCRCGASQNKPFCDGAHKSTGFEAD
ncbi:MAG: CDGSH iron-sulfur domain-containing protein [Dehalococcoidia bacterium]